MEVFDKVSQRTIDRRDRQLAFLALVMVIILGGGMALIMYPIVFRRSAVMPLGPSRTLFFGFCVLCLLMVAYLINRMFVVRSLRASLFEEREELVRVLQESSAELLGTLKGFSHFQDRLTMDFRRAVQTAEPLSLLLVRVKPSRMFARGTQSLVVLGDSAKVISRKLRTEDSLFRLSDEVFGVVLPNATEEFAQRAADRLSEGLADASGASERFTAAIQVVNYPIHTQSASEMERRASALITQA